MPQVHALIIDDNAGNIGVLVQLLTLENVATTTLSQIHNLKQILDTLQTVNIVFLDLEFPQSNGYEALPIIKGHPNFQDVPVVAYTVHVNEVNEAFKLGFNGFLGKPLNAEAFPDQLARLLRGERVWHLP